MRLLSSSYLPDRLPTDPPRSQSLVPTSIRSLQVYAKISLGSCLAICTYVFQIKMFLLFRGLYLAQELFDKKKVNLNHVRLFCDKKLKRIHVSST